MAVQIPVPKEREFGLRNPRKLQDPKLPSKKEAEDHLGTCRTATGAPSASWAEEKLLHTESSHAKMAFQSYTSTTASWEQRKDRNNNSRCQGDDIEDGLGDDGSHEGGID